MGKLRIFKSALALLLCVFLTSCNEFGASVDDLLTAPQLTGNIYEIQQALERDAGRPIDLKYPQRGENLSAFNLYDTDDDGEVEAVAFYRYKDDTDGIIFMSYIDKTDDKWQVVGTGKITASDVERVDFADLDGNGTSEIIVGWSIFSTVEKTATVYTATSELLTQRISEPYNEYVLCDLMESGHDQLLLINLNTTDKTSTAKLYHLQGDAVIEEGTAQLDGSITAYSTPIIAKLASDRTALYLDAAKASGAMITEIIYYDPPNVPAELTDAGEQNYDIVRTGALVSPFHDSTTYENAITARPTAVAAQDIDADGVIEIPLMTELPGFASRTDDEKLYITAWRSYDEKRFETKLSAVMNYPAGYYIACPASWQEALMQTNITVSRSADYKLLSFYEWNNTIQQRGAELFRIQLFTRAEWENRDETQDGATYVPIKSDKDRVFAISTINSTSPLTLNESTIKDYFHLIEN